MKNYLWIAALIIAGLFTRAFASAENDSALITPTSPDSRPVLGLYGGAGEESYRQAVDLKFTYIFPPVHWYSDHGWMKVKVELAHAEGLKVCPSYGVAFDGYGDNRSEFAKSHPEWWEVRRDGSKTNKDVHVGLSFGIPEVRKHKVDTFIKHICDYDLDGILLDYTRMFDRNCGYHPNIVQAFKDTTGRDPTKIPNSDPQWVRFRCEVVTTFVRELRKEANAVAAERGRPVELLACVDPDPQERLYSVLQDWQAWVDEGLVQGIVTMVYHHDPNETIESVRVANEACRGKAWHMPMIAPYHYYLTTDELLLDASLKCLKTGTQALAFYRDDYISKYEQWDAVGKVSRWTSDEIGRMPVNYVRNPGFELGMENWADSGNPSIARTKASQSARSGDSAIRLSGTRALRQIIDRGLPTSNEASSVILSCWVKGEVPSVNEGLFIDVSINQGKGNDSDYRVPVSLTGEGEWQQFQIKLPLDTSLPLNHILFGVVSELTSADLLIDDFSVGLGNEPYQPTVNYAISRRQASKNWKPSSENLFRGQCVTCSSYWEAGTECDNAVDGDLSTENYGYGAVWVSQRPAENQSILISLPAPKPISRIRILNNASQSAYRTREYKVELSVDGRVFRKVAKGQLPDDGTTWTENRFRTRTAKYIRFTGISGYNREYAIGIQEIEGYGPNSR